MAGVSGAGQKQSGSWREINPEVTRKRIFQKWAGGNRHQRGNCLVSGGAWR
jgi:hypothetical protein